MTGIFDGVEPMVVRSRINVPYTWWAGETAGAFFTALRDEKKITGRKCAKCGKTYVPPRKVCPVCFEDGMEWVEVSTNGTLESFTIVRRQLASLPRKVPVVFGLIRLDGADTSVLHYVEAGDLGMIKIGMRLAAKFCDERNGSINDIECFFPA
ncbi:MAG: Zn-ribbon domain-containing OB-fold protein [Desulfobacteraceae bacterium]|jgi:hypothetical protein|nr:MAG: Zn-ribbon domain-containing OB-fold protein [Desulfobacteraceae bacterium]